MVFELVWEIDFEGKDESMAWVDDDTDRFIHLFPVGERDWCIRIGLRKSVSQNQQRCFKNRSRAMISVKQLLNSESW